ncbi:MAG TPA: acetamidase/formamidase family protein [Bryobacteraceae bacterium]|jgi:acetamidase/formamidase
MLRPILLLVAASLTVSAQVASSPAGQWVSHRKYADNNFYQRMQLELNGGKLTGKFGGQDLDGTFAGGRIEATVKLTPSATLKLTGTLANDRIEGTAKIDQGDQQFVWTAVRIAPKRAPKTHTFEPVQFEHFFSDAIKPVLNVFPGDTIRTWTVDAGGFDAKNQRRTSGGNPLTGPFYVEGAMPGDTLVVHFNRVRLNRDTAISSPLIVNSALSPGYVERRKEVKDYSADWKLDRQGGFASLLKPTNRLKDYRIPLAPMMGCVGVAPGGGNQFRSGYLGGFGGNMDYNRLREGITVYLPVSTPGALLFVGDGHAAQGAGELTGNALETSMDVEFTVDLIEGKAAGSPRMEDDEFLMASGMSQSLDDAFRDATTNLVRWLENTYGLNAAEVSSVVSSAVIYDIAEYVDPEDHVVARIPKSVLAGLTKVK